MRQSTDLGWTKNGQPQEPTLPLFESAPPVYAESRGRAFDALAAAARAKLGVAEWEWWAWEILDGPGGEALVTGGVPSNPSAKPNRGRWKGVAPQKILVTRSDLAAASAEYERTTGVCAECVAGQRCHGWNHATGFRYKPCQRCNGSGRAPTRPEALDLAVDRSWSTPNAVALTPSVIGESQP